MSRAACVVLAAWMLAGVCLLPGHSTGQDAPAPMVRNGHGSAPRAPLEYRSVFVPTEKLADLATGYLPVQRTEFQQLLATINASPNGPGGANARLTRATYTARLQGSDLVDGDARLQVQHKLQDSALLGLEPCTMAITKPRWLSAAIPPQTTETESAARLGIDAAGRLAVVVEAATSGEKTHSQDLRFAWTLRGARDPAGALIFDLQAPACPTSQLRLDLPQGLLPAVSQGLISKLPTTATDVESKRQPWLVEFGGNTKTTLSLSSGTNVAQTERYILLKQTAAYELDTTALEVEFEFDLDIYHEPLRQLTLTSDSGLELTSARLGEKELAWTVSPIEGQSQRRLVIEFSEPLQGADRVVRLTAIAPIQWERAWQLPSLYASGVSWQEGVLSLNVADGVELRDVVTDGCRQTRYTSRSSPKGSDIHQFQAFTPEANLRIFAGHPALRLKATSGLTLKWDGPNVAGRWVADIIATQGQTHELLASVATGWNIDAVEALPATALDDWSIKSQGGAPDQLKIRLAQAIQSQQGVRLIVLGHRRAPIDHPLSPDEYRLVEMPQLATHRPLVAAQPEAQQQLGLQGDADLERLDPGTLSDAERSLFDGPPPRLLFVDTSAHPEFGLQLRSERPRYAAQILLTATLTATELREEYQVNCVPEATALTRLWVRLDPARSETLTWRIDGDEASEITARRLTDGEQMDAALGAGEIWEVVLQRPRSSPFVLRASRSTSLAPGDPPRPLALASLPEADSQTGEVEIHSRGGATLWIEPTGLKPTIPPPLPFGQTSSRRALFRYTPAQEQRLLVGHAPKDSQLPALWAWRAVTTAQLSATGTCLYNQRYELESIGQASVAVQLPTEASLREVRVNGTRVAVTPEEASPKLTIPLPSEQRYVTLEVDYQVSHGHLPLWGKQSLRLAALVAPVLATNVELWLPAELASPDVQPTRSNLDWRKRLFGPMSRAADVPALRLFSLSDWRRELLGETIAPQEQASAEQCWQAWTMLLDPVDDTLRPRTLGEWISRYDRLASDNSEQLPKLRIDASQLEQAGWYADTPLPLAKNETHVAAADVLRKAGLALVIYNDEVRLSTREALQSDKPTRLVTISSQALFVATSSQRDMSNTGTIGKAPLLRASAWLAKPATARSPWPALKNAALASLAASGWERFDLPSGESGQLTVTIHRRGDLQAMAWGWFLATVALVYWWGKHRPGYWSIFCATGAVLALLLPVPLAPLGTASFLGSLTAGLALLLMRRKQRTIPAPASTMTHATAQPVTALVILALLIGCCHVVAAQEPKDPATTQAEAFRVLIPVNEKQEPETDVVYLPKPFYDTLYRLSQAAKATPQGWMIYDANYRGRMQWEVAGGRLDFSELFVTYDLEVFQPNTRVIIGLGRENVNLLDDRVKLEEQAVRIQWLESGEGFALPVEKPGRYRLELALRPTVRTVGTRAEIDLKIPRLARSQLSLRIPIDAPPVQVSRALGTQTTGDPGELRVDLGPAERLAVHWNLPRTAETPMAEVEATQLLWWRIRPGATVIDAVWRFKSNGPPLREVRLVADPRLRLLPLDPKEPVLEQFVRDGDVKAIQFVLKEPYEREVTLHTSFTLTGSSGIGSLALPKLLPVADRITRRWLAITAASTLDARFDPTTAPEALSAQEFLTAWGEAEATPQQTYRLPLGDEPFTLRIKPREPQVSAVQALRYRFDENRVEIALEADCHVSDGQIFQQRLTVPSGFQTTRIEVIDNDGLAVREARGAMSSPDAMTVFLPAATAGDYQLSVQGFVTAPRRGAWQLPMLTLRQAQLSTATLRIEAADTLQLTIPRDPPGYQQRGRLESGETHETWLLEPRDPAILLPLEIRLAPNLCRWQAQQVLALNYKNDAWQAILDCHADVTMGSLRTLRWEIPADWHGPFRTNLPATLEVVTIPGQARRQLLAHLHEAQSKAFHFQVAAPLAAPVGERLQAPEVTLLDAEVVETFVVLPAEADQQSVAWETLGLQAVDLPAARRAAVAPGMQAYLVVGARYQASIKRIERLAGVPQVRLVDVRVASNSSGAIRGVASFDLEPAGLLACPLLMPAGYELIAATVSDQPAIAVRKSDHQWQIWLQHEQLPQHIEIVFRRAPDDHSPPTPLASLVTPQLAGLPVERTLWTIDNTNELPTLTLAEPDSRGEAIRQNLFRIKNSATLLEQADGILSDGDTEESRAWFVPWARVSAAAHAQFAREQVNRPSQSVALASEVQSLAAEAQTIVQQWNVADDATKVIESSSLPSGAADIMGALDEGRSLPLHAILSGSVPEIEIRREGIVSWTNVACWFAAAAVIFVALLLRTLRRWEVFCDVVLHYPHAMGILAGLAWWCCLQPSFLGLGIVLLFTLAALRWPWPVVREPAPQRAMARQTRYRP